MDSDCIELSDVRQSQKEKNLMFSVSPLYAESNQRYIHVCKQVYMWVPYNMQKRIRKAES